MKPKLVIWGASSQAMVVAEIVRLNDEYELAGFLDDLNPQRRCEQFCGAPILGGAEALDELWAVGVRHLVFGFGHNLARLRLAVEARQRGFELAIAIHPRAIVSANARVAAGSVIKAGAIVDPGAELGENVIIGAGATVAHGCRLEDGARLSAGANLGGSVHVGRAAWVGLGASVKDRIYVGAEAIIGAGAVAVHDVPARVIMVGVPAQILRGVKPDDF